MCSSDLEMLRDPSLREASMREAIEVNALHMLTKLATPLHVEVVPMLRKAGTEEVRALLGSAKLRAAKVAEAHAVLCEAGDQDALRLRCARPPAPAPPPLSPTVAPLVAVGDCPPSEFWQNSPPPPPPPKSSSSNAAIAATLHASSSSSSQPPSAEDEAAKRTGWAPPYAAQRQYCEEQYPNQVNVDKSIQVRYRTGTGAGLYASKLSTSRKPAWHMGSGPKRGSDHVRWPHMALPTARIGAPRVVSTPSMKTTVRTNLQTSAPRKPSQPQAKSVAEVPVAASAPRRHVSAPGRGHGDAPSDRGGPGRTKPLSPHPWRKQRLGRQEVTPPKSGYKEFVKEADDKEKVATERVAAEATDRKSVV